MTQRRIPFSSSVPLTDTYRRRVTRRHPGLLLLVLNCSASMQEAYGSGTQAMAAARLVNRLLYEQILESGLASRVGEDRGVAVIGYGRTVEPLIPFTWLSHLADHPLRVEIARRHIPDGTGALIEVDWEEPVWLEPRASGNSLLAEAFVLAHTLAAQWIAMHLYAFPPAVIHITAEEPDDAQEAYMAAAELRALQSTDGHLLLWNIGLSTSVAADSWLPASPHELASHERFLFELSSKLPTPLLEEARCRGLAAPPAARACIVQRTGVDTLPHLPFFGRPR